MSVSAVAIFTSKEEEILNKKVLMMVTTIFVSGQNMIIFKDYCYSTLYILYIFGFGPKYRLFHYAKLPSYKRMKRARLTGPFHKAFDQPTDMVRI